MTTTITSRLYQQLQNEPKSDLARLLRRATVQIEFARAFTAIKAESEAQWSTLIDRAEQLLETFDAAKGLSGLKDTLSEAEELLSEIGRAAKAYRIHSVGHGHIDMNWMWSWPETVATTHDTFASVLHLMRKYPDLTYSQSQASVYALIEKYHPAMFEEIRQRVAEGRWEVTAAHWVEGDKNLASGESLCRHMLYTRRYCEEKFGLSAEDLPIDWEPDTFGHASSIPSFLRQGGVKYYYCCRLGGGYEHSVTGEARPRLFYWQSPDGSRVLVNKESTWYNSYVNIGENIALPLIGFARETGLHEWLNVFGIGNHGGGPTQVEIEYFRELQEWPIYPQVEFSTTKRYFEAVEGEIDSTSKIVPTFTGELNFEFTGCYTSQSLIKQANRFGENYLEEAETLAAISNRVNGGVYPRDAMREAWLKVLFNQFHDILPGSGVRQTREHAMAEFQEVGAITGAIKREVTKTLADRIDTISLLPDTWAGNEECKLAGEDHFGSAFEAGPGFGAMESGLSLSGSYGQRFRHFVVFNTCGWARSEKVTVALYDANFDPGQVVAFSDDGEVQPALYLSTASGEWWGHSRQFFTFNANDIPAVGYRTFVLCERAGLSRDHLERLKNQEVTPLGADGFKTPFMKLRVDRELGGVNELVDKRTGARILGPSAQTPLGSLRYVVERSKGMTAWVLGRQVDPPKALRSTSFQTTGFKTNEGTRMPSECAPAGILASHVLKVAGTSNSVRLSMAIDDKEPRLDFVAEVDWREFGGVEQGIPGLIVSVPLALTSITARYEVPFGSIERDVTSGEEVPALRYAHVEGTALTADGKPVFAGVTLLQDCKYGHSITGSDQDGYVLNLRIVRSSFDPDPTPEIAVSAVRYSIYLHDQPADPASLTRLGSAFNHPLLPIPTSAHSGDAPTARGFARVLSDNIVLTALKKSEDGDGLILRLVELNGQDTEAVVEISPEMTCGYTAADVLDLMERPTGTQAQWQSGTLRVPIAANSFVTVVIK